MPVAVVTGAGSGIGRAVTQRLIFEGYYVFLAGRNEKTLLETLATSNHHQERASVIVTDVTQEESVQSLFRRVEEMHGRIDLLFNNAGIGSFASEIDSIQLENWNQVVAVNLTGVFLCSREAFRLMKRQQPIGGRIINNGSISATTPRPLSAPYTATKHAVTGLTKSLALDGRKYGITCGQIDIGNADTTIASQMKKGILQSDGSTRIEPTIDVACVADAVMTMARMPSEANVLQMTVMAAKMPFVGRG
jgi:NAD(P)-dependent dehydrogenase (short-subunit alcohol dehydrogenase family)